MPEPSTDRLAPASPPPEPALKRLEIAGKLLAGAIAALFLYRPWRRRTLDRTPRRVLVVRVDHRVGEALLTTPVLETLKRLTPAPEVDVLVHPKIARVLQGHPAIDRLICVDPRRLGLAPFDGRIAELRRQRYELVVNCASWTAPSVSPSLLARWCGPDAVVVGPKLWPLTWLQTISVEPRPDTRSEVVQRVHLLSPLPGFSPVHRLSFRSPSVGEGVAALLRELEASPFAVVNPGGRLDARRVPAEVFAAGARSLSASGVRPVITWGPGEEPLAKEVAAAAPGSALAPPTTIDELAALMARARLTLCNNTGPMHLSVAVGAPTLALFVAMEVERWGHGYAPHRMLDLTGRPAKDQCEQVEAELKSMLESPREALGA